MVARSDKFVSAMSWVSPVLLLSSQGFLVAQTYGALCAVWAGLVTLRSWRCVHERKGVQHPQGASGSVDPPTGHHRLYFFIQCQSVADCTLCAPYLRAHVR